MNVLIYAGRGVSTESLHHTVRSLRNAIGTFYDIKLVNAANLASDPWEAGCSLLVIPGGRDLPFVQDLAGRPIERIRNFVLQRKGRFLGICAGAYFACHRVEFEEGTPLEVIGMRELNLCPATAKGTIYPGFEYETSRGAHAVPLSLDGALCSKAFSAKSPLKVYYDGGCYFDFGEKDGSEDGKTLEYHVGAFYKDKNLPAIVLGYASGEDHPRVILSGVHIEYDAEEVAVRNPDLPILDTLKESSTDGWCLWGHVLSTFGLIVRTHRDASTPSPTPLYMFFPEIRRRAAFLTTLRGNESFSEENLNCENLKISIHLTAPPAMLDFAAGTYPLIVTDNNGAWKNGEGGKWSFSPDRYYAHLAENPTIKCCEHIGRHLLYAEYLPSTQTILSQNSTLMEILPNGSVVLAGDQLAGKGRGANSWLSSKGCLQFTMLLHHQDAKTLTLIQYLTGLAMVEAIRSEPGYEDLEVRLKWPNDLYTTVNGELRKMGGILVNSQSFGDGFILLIGFGTNIYDTPWTRSLNDLVAIHNEQTGTCLSPWTKELLLSRFMGKFADLYRQLLTLGFPFEQYYKRWLHTDQTVFLESEQMRVRIKGIDEDGFLIVKPHTDGLLGLLSEAPELSGPAAKSILLQPDGNSFDMMQNLIKRKQ
jgi:biotin--protein ligase